MSKVEDKDGARLYVVQVRLSAREREELERGAIKTGLSMSELIRRALFERYKGDD